MTSWRKKTIRNAHQEADKMSEEKRLQEIKELLGDMIRNKCVNPPGDEMRSIRTLEAYLAAHGVESQVFLRFLYVR